MSVCPYGLTVSARSVWSHCVFMVPMALCVCMVCMVSLCVHDPHGSLRLHGLYGLIVGSCAPWLSVSAWSMCVHGPHGSLILHGLYGLIVGSWSPWLYLTAWSVWSHYMCSWSPCSL